MYTMYVMGGGIAGRSEFRCSNGPCLIFRSIRYVRLLFDIIVPANVLLCWASGWRCRPIDYSINNMFMCCAVIKGWAQVQHSTRNSIYAGECRE